MVYAKLMGSVNVKVDGQGLTAQQVKALIAGFFFLFPSGHRNMLIRTRFVQTLKTTNIDDLALLEIPAKYHKFGELRIYSRRYH